MAFFDDFSQKVQAFADVATEKTKEVVDSAKLSEEEQAAFDAVDLGRGVLTQEELLSRRLPEMPARLVPIIEEIWLDQVVGQYNS